MAKNRRRQTREFLAKHPLCIFCGGTTPATTRDHVPSRQAFYMKDWPEGYEFPACEACNGATRNEEQVIALLSRLFPDSKTSTERREIKAIMKAVGSNYPGVIQEMCPTREQHLEFVAKPWAQQLFQQGLARGPLSLGGPLVKACMTAYARKLITALHYKEFGKVVPVQGGILWRWYSNVQRIEGKTPDELVNMMGGRPIVRRGRRDLSDQFSYNFVQAADGELTGYFAMFRFSFAILGFVEMDASRFDFGVDETDILRPLPVRHAA